MLVALRVTVFCLFIYYYCDVVAIMYRGGVIKQQEAIESIIKHQEVPNSFRRFQEAPGSLRKHHEGTILK